MTLDVKRAEKDEAIPSFLSVMVSIVFLPFLLQSSPSDPKEKKEEEEKKLSEFPFRDWVLKRQIVFGRYITVNRSTFSLDVSESNKIFGRELTYGWIPWVKPTGTDQRNAPARKPVIGQRCCDWHPGHLFFFSSPPLSRLLDSYSIRYVLFPECLSSTTQHDL